MNDITMLDSVERYIRGEMNTDEKRYFENLRNASTELDQLVVEHTLFLQQMDLFGESKQIRSTLHDVHTNLSEQGVIKPFKPDTRAKVIYFWNRYKKITAIAASIAGITTIGISMLVNSFAPNKKDPKVQELVKQVNVLDKKIENVDKKINADRTKTQPIITTPVRFNGTGFLIDPNGLMITNAHVVKNSVNIFVQNNKGDQFKAYVVRLDIPRDVAIIKIDDDRFKSFASLPYGIRKTGSDIAEPIFTLGFPRNEIVYGEGYLSAKTGFNGDTLSCQIAVAANPGNSGGPIFNHDGEVIGILSAKETQSEGAVFAVQSKYIYRVMDELKKNPLYKNVKLPGKSKLTGYDKIQQVKKIRDYVFMVKGD